MKIFGINRRIACRPFTTRAVTTKVTKGFGTVENKAQLIGLEVVFGTPEGFGNDLPILPGCTVFVKGDSSRTPWAVEVFDVQGQDVILVPVDQVQLVAAPAVK